MTRDELNRLNEILAKLELLDNNKSYTLPKSGVIDLLIEAGPLAKKRKKMFSKLDVQVGDAVKYENETMLVKRVVIDVDSLKILELELVNKTGLTIGPVAYNEKIKLIS